MAKKVIPNYQVPFWVRTKNGTGSFVDHETGLNVHGHSIAEVTKLGSKTQQWLRAGGLVVVDDDEIDEKQDKGLVIESDCFTAKTKIVMVPAKGSRYAPGTLVPKEVPVDPEPKINDDAGKDDDDEEEEEDKDEASSKTVSKTPSVAKDKNGNFSDILKDVNKESKK